MRLYDPRSRLLRWTWYSTGGMDTLVGGTRWEYPLGPGNPPAVQAEYLPLRDHLGSTVMLMRAEYTTDLGQFYGVFAEPEPPPGGQSLIEPENAGFGLKVAETFDYDPYGWPTVHAPFGSPAKFGDPVVGLLAIRSGQVGALEGSLTNSPLLSGRELWQWYTNEPGGNPMLVESETTRAPHASTGWRHLYTGRTWDSQSRSYYYRHRWYDPHQARFLSRDPIGYEAGLLQYAYVGGDPITYIDPLGLDPKSPSSTPTPDCPGDRLSPTPCAEIDDQEYKTVADVIAALAKKITDDLKSAGKCLSAAEVKTLERRLRTLFDEAQLRYLNRIFGTCYKSTDEKPASSNCAGLMYALDRDSRLGGNGEKCPEKRDDHIDSYDDKSRERYPPRQISPPDGNPLGARGLVEGAHTFMSLGSFSGHTVVIERNGISGKRRLDASGRGSGIGVTYLPEDGGYPSTLGERHPPSPFLWWPRYQRPQVQ